MSIQEFRNWFEKETTNIVKPLDKEANGLIEDVKKKIRQAQEACEGLIKECEREIEKGKAYHRSRVAKKLAQLFIDTLNNVHFPESISHKTTEILVKDLKKALSTIERERNIWFSRISPLFIMARRKIDVVLSRLYESVEKLESFTSERYVKAKNVTDCITAADNIAELQNELLKIEREKNETESTISSVDKQIEETKQKILNIQQKDEVKTLIAINRQAKELDRKVKRELQYLQKPFVKLQNLYHSGTVSIPTEELEKLNEYLAHPSSTLAKEEQGYPVCKKILQRVNEAIKQEKLKIKTSRQKKALDQIDAILKNDSLSELQRQCTQVYQQRKQLLATGSIATFKNQTTNLKASFKELERQKEHLISKLSNLQNSHKEKKDRLETRKKELEKATSDITRKNVRLNV
jgi:DNA repair exonuclease SbcCD ATPase subunit